MQFRGPHYETPAEVRMAGVLGGHLVGMSTTLEAIAAREAGMEVLGLSLVTNLAAGISDAPLNHEEVLAAGRDAASGWATCSPRWCPRSEPPPRSGMAMNRHSPPRQAVGSVGRSWGATSTLRRPRLSPAGRGRRLGHRRGPAVSLRR